MNLFIEFYLFNCLGRLNIYFVGLNRFIMKNVSFIALNDNGSTASPWLSIVRLVVVGLCVGGGGKSPHLPCGPTQYPPSHFIPPPPPPTSRHFEHPPPTLQVQFVLFIFFILFFWGGGGRRGGGLLQDLSHYFASASLCILGLVGTSVCGVGGSISQYIQ